MKIQKKLTKKNPQVRVCVQWSHPKNDKNYYGWNEKNEKKR